MIRVARIYLRVSTEGQDLTRQEQIERDARANGFYVAGVYREKASGAVPDRPELNRMIADLQEGDVVIAEKIDRISRLPLPEAEKLIKSIKAKGAKLAIPGIVDLSEFIEKTDKADDITRIVLESMQDLLLKLALQMARDDYELRRERQRQGVEIAKANNKFKGRQANKTLHQRVIVLRQAGHSIAKTALLAVCSESQVKRIWAMNKLNNSAVDAMQINADSINIPAV